MRPWHTIFRNRRGALCAVCVCLMFFVPGVTTMWIVDVARHGWHDLPGGFVPAIVALGAVKGWQYREDGKGPDTPPTA